MKASSFRTWSRAARLLGLVMASSAPARADLFEYPPFTEWYENPLGFSPLDLHTKNALLLPALVAAGLLLVTERATAQPREWSFVADTGISWGYNPPYTTVASESFGVLYWPRAWMAFGAEVTLYHPYDAVNRTSGVGLRPFVRFYPIQGSRVRAFFAAGAGAIVFADEFPAPFTGYGFLDNPRRGTHVNGTPVYGAAVEVTLAPEIDVFVGVRHVHVSNGNALGEQRNPGHDSNGFQLGVVLPLE